MNLEELKSKIRMMESNGNVTNSSNMSYLFLNKKNTPLTCILLPIFNNGIEQEFFILKKSIYINNHFYTFGYNESLNAYMDNDLLRKAFDNTSTIRSLSGKLGISYNQFREYVLNINNIIVFPIYNLKDKTINIVSWVNKNPLVFVNNLISTISKLNLEYADVINYTTAHGVMIDIDDAYLPVIKVSKQKININLDVDTINQIYDVITKNNISSDIENDMREFITMQNDYISKLQSQLNRFDGSDANSFGSEYINETTFNATNITVEEPTPNVDVDNMDDFDEDIVDIDDIEIPGLDKLIDEFGIK